MCMLQTIENDEIDDLDEESILTILFISALSQDVTELYTGISEVN